MKDVTITTRDLFTHEEIETAAHALSPQEKRFHQLTHTRVRHRKSLSQLMKEADATRKRNDVQILEYNKKYAV